MKIQDIFINEIKDSRSEPTIEVVIENEKSDKFSSQIPSGKSRGSREAVVFAPAKAKEVLASVKKEIIGQDFSNIKAFDDFLLGLDGTANKSKLGGNLMLGLSLAFARSLAKENNLELWQILKQEFFPKSSEAKLPKIFSNLINGGAHAKNNLDIQEFLVIAEPQISVAATFQKLTDFYQDLGEALKDRYGLEEIGLGDEGGYSLDFPNNLEAIKILSEQINKSNLAQEFSLGLDAAASSFYKNGKYVFETQSLSSDELLQIYSVYFQGVPLLNSIEDPFDENDGLSFADLLHKLKNKLVVGDDLTTTQSEMIQSCAIKNFINGVIIKPNQIGTVSETCAAINIAHHNNVKCIISHRSGETPDNFLIHFAKASGAYGVKIGAPHGSRLTKFEEMLRIYS